MTQPSVILAVVGIVAMVGLVKFMGVRLSDWFVVGLLAVGSVAIVLVLLVMPLR